MILITEGNSDYELLDSGEEQKLERFGSVILSRPDPQALWPKSNQEIWHKADAVFDRKWKQKLDDWQIEFEGLKFLLKLLPSKHVGLFPEQSVYWKWFSSHRMSAKKVLNLFANTGGASLACAKAGAEVTHVDSAQFIVDWAMKNTELNHISNIRFIADDVKKFVEKEIRRNKKYDIITLDPPVYGKAGKSVWKIENDLMLLLLRLKNLKPKIILLNGYASVYSDIAYANMLSSLNLGGRISCGQLAIKDNSGKLLPSGIFAKWEA